MRHTPKTIIGFDRTLVREQSSGIFEDVVFDYWDGRRAHTAHFILRGHLAPFTRVTLRAASFITRRDSRVWLLVWLARPLLKAKLPQIARAAAKRLTLNDQLAAQYSQPFTILTGGLEPVVRAFLRLHPELDCLDVLSSQLNAGPKHFAVRLRPMRFKVKTMRHFQPKHYLTDQPREARLMQSKLRRRYRIKPLKTPGAQPIYQLTLKA